MNRHPALRRRPLAVVAAAASVCLIVAGAAQASSTGSSAQPTHLPPPIAKTAATAKFSAAARAVGAGKTPEQRAAIMEHLTSTLPVQVAAYDVKPLWKKGIDGTGTSIATIVSYGDPNIQAVIDSYDAHYGLPKANVTIIQPDGDASCPAGHEGTCASWAGETDLDIEMMHTIAPGAHLYVVATPIAETEGIHGFPAMMKAIDYVTKHHTVDVISMSLGATEQTFKSFDQMKSLDPTFQAASAAGIPVVAASGDQGATGHRYHGQKYYKHRVVGFPASSPYVTAVGGTVLHFSGQHRVSPDTLWQESGGGVSATYPRPSWQDSVAGITQSKMRAMPDITMEGIEGTSMAAPLFAGILALATQENGKPLGFLNDALYSMGKNAAKNGLVDVTTGNNTFAGVTGYTCAKGFDIASGWGTVDGAVFVPALVNALKS